jgi:hypothetical protein
VCPPLRLTMLLGRRNECAVGEAAASDDATVRKRDHFTVAVSDAETLESSASRTGSRTNTGFVCSSGSSSGSVSQSRTLPSRSFVIRFLFTRGAASRAQPLP